MPSPLRYSTTAASPARQSRESQPSYESSQNARAGASFASLTDRSANASNTEKNNQYAEHSLANSTSSSNGADANIQLEEKLVSSTALAEIIEQEARSLTIGKSRSRSRSSVECLIKMPRIRGIQMRSGRKIRYKPIQNLEAAIAQTRGVLHTGEKACLPCRRILGPFAQCVRVPGQFMESCASCHYNAMGARCSFRQTVRVIAGESQHNTEATEPNTSQQENTHPAEEDINTNAGERAVVNTTRSTPIASASSGLVNPPIEASTIQEHPQFHTFRLQATPYSTTVDSVSKSTSVAAAARPTGVGKVYTATTTSHVATSSESSVAYRTGPVAEPRSQKMQKVLNCYMALGQLMKDMVSDMQNKMNSIDELLTALGQEVAQVQQNVQ
ncbi:hypothetical protein BDZ91DRAFT_798766 [Kalaharituber pfeilii]|nr:hypothetical protein BDZ91DRAFT_798766 [Kalaharituber pfeilii]